MCGKPLVILRLACSIGSKINITESTMYTYMFSIKNICIYVCVCVLCTVAHHLTTNCKQIKQHTHGYKLFTNNMSATIEKLEANQKATIRKPAAYYMQPFTNCQLITTSPTCNQFANHLQKLIDHHICKHTSNCKGLSLHCMESDILQQELQIHLSRYSTG